MIKTIISFATTNGFTINKTYTYGTYNGYLVSIDNVFEGNIPITRIITSVSCKDETEKSSLINFFDWS